MDDHILEYLDSLPYCMFDVLHNGAITYMNKHGRDMFGISQEDIDRGLTAIELTAPEYREQLLRDIAEIQKSSGFEKYYDYEVLLADGTHLPVRAYAMATRLAGGEFSLRGTLMDISDLKAVEAALKKSEDRYALVARGANDGMWDWDVATNEVYYSPRYKEIIGYKDHEFQNNSVSWTEQIHPDDLAHTIEANRRCIEGEVDQFEVEYRMLHKDGTWRWILGRGAAARDEQGNTYRMAGTHTDITERKNAIAALQESRERHEALSRATFEAIFISEGGKLLTANETAATMFGYRQEDFQKLMGRDLAAPEQADIIDRAIRENWQHSYEIIAQRSDGTRFPAEFQGKSFRYKGQETRVTAVRDVSEKKRAEEKYRGIFENAIEGIYQSTPHGMFLSVNTSLARIFGYESPTEMLANITDISRQIYVRPSVRDELLLRLTNDHHVNKFEAEAYRKDGSTIWISESCRAVFDEQDTFKYYEGFMEDITDRKETEHRMSCLHEISRSVNLTTDLDSLYPAIHSTLDKYIEARNFFIGLVDEENDCLKFPYYCDEHDKIIYIGNISDPNTQSLSLTVIRSGEAVLYHKDELHSGELSITGTTPVIWLGVPLIVGGRSIGIMAVQHYSNPSCYSSKETRLMESVADLVALGIERRMNTDALQQMNEQLESMVAIRTSELEKRSAELEAANRRLQEIDELKSSILSSISHELRTPLTSIRGFAKLTGRDFERHFMPAQNEQSTKRKQGDRILRNMLIIESEGERLTRLINDFLDLNKIESGQMTWNDCAVDIRDILSQTVSAVSGQFDIKPGVELKLTVPEELPNVLLDRDRLFQVLMNLLHNAAKFTDDGHVEVRAEASDTELILTISDTGIGIPESELPKIFEKFHNANRGDTLTGTHSGTGLGLAICKEIVDHYKGSISATSAPGQGSTFTIALPLAGLDS